MYVECCFSNCRSEPDTALCPKRVNPKPGVGDEPRRDLYKSEGGGGGGV